MRIRISQLCGPRSDSFVLAGFLGGGEFAQVLGNGVEELRLRLIEMVRRALPHRLVRWPRTLQITVSSCRSHGHSGSRSGSRQQSLVTLIEQPVALVQIPVLVIVSVDDAAARMPHLHPISLIQKLLCVSQGGSGGCIPGTRGGRTNCVGLVERALLLGFGKITIHSEIFL